MNNSAIFSTGSGGFLNSVGSGVMVSIENTLVANNTAGGSGGALFFKSGALRSCGPPACLSVERSLEERWRIAWPQRCVHERAHRISSGPAQA